MTWIRSSEEVQRALEIQRQALESSCVAYDNGNRWEASRIATTVMVLVHDAGRNQSILRQLGIKGKLRFITSAFQYSPRNVLRETHLLSTRVYNDGTAEYAPLLDGAPHGLRRLQFHDWWESELIFRDGTFRLTRKRLAHVLRNQEGGAHFDPILQDANYLRFAKEQLTTPYVVSAGMPPRAILGAEWASMRQVGWELLETLKTTKTQD